MRPIDADALTEIVEHFSDVCLGSGKCYCTKTQFIKAIKKAPTLTAVPTNTFYKEVICGQSKTVSNS